jgi:hypothetical protein
MLAELGLVKLVKRRPRRGAIEHYYKARGRAEVTDRASAQVPSVVRTSMVGVALEQALGRAVAAVAGGGFEGDHARMARQSLRLDSEGVYELADAMTRLQQEADEIAARSAERTDRGQDVGLITLLFDEAPPAQPDPG